MDFLFGSQTIDNTTCLIHLANQFIINKDIKPNNGYILLFTPPHSPNDITDSNKKDKKRYIFEEKFSDYFPGYKKYLDLIKCYSLNNFEKACDLINNFILISQKNKGLKLILIDDITRFINIWTSELFQKRENKTKKEESSKEEKRKNILLLYNQIFQNFLSKIYLLQKCYKIQCFITINLVPSDKINFAENSSRVFNAIFPFVRSSFCFQKSEENQIDFEEIKLILNMKTNKIELAEFKGDESNVDYREELFYELINGTDKKPEKQINKAELDEKWIKETIGDFIENINEYTKKQIEKEKEKQDSSYDMTQDNYK